jgi:hypothetical protein
MLRRAIVIGSFSACAFALAVACGGGDDSNGSTSGDGGSGSDATTGDASSNGDGSTTPRGDGGLPSGWLYTSGNTIFVSSGGGTDTQWMARGVNTDDLFLCGYNNTLAMTGPNGQEILDIETTHLIADWKPTFIRVSLSMNSFAPQTWIGDGGAYKAGMTDVIDTLGSNPGVYVLVTLRTERSMIDQDPGNQEATNVPSDGTTTPDKTNYPNGTDDVYRALVDTFANANFVLFGLSNEPGGNTITKDVLVPRMTHAAQTIRDEEDKLGVPHHLISVQGTGYTSTIDFYSTTPLTIDNIVYEVHGYPPTNYTFPNIPVILGEYGPGGTPTLVDAGGVGAGGFYDDIEAKKIPNIAWIFDSYSGCGPDLLDANHTDDNLVPTAWGTTVKTYLNAHAK